MRGGWSVINSDSKTRTDFRGYVGDGRLRWRPTRRGSMQFDWRREPNFSVYEDAVYVLERSAKLSGVYYLSWPVGIETGVRKGKLTFPGSRTDRKDDIMEYEAGVRLRLSENQMGRRVEYNLTWTYWDSDSNQDELDRTRTQIGFGAVVGF